MKYITIIFKLLFKLLFLFLFFLSLYYINFIQTEKHESKSIVMIKDLSNEQSSSVLGSLLMSGTGSEGLTDAMLLEVYIKSADMFNLLNKEFNLTAYYTGKEIDILNRLSNGIPLPIYEDNYENLLSKYIKDITILYDDLSGTLEIKFMHADAVQAHKIVESIIKHASKILNFFEKKNTEVALSFLEKQEKEKHALFLQSLEKLLIYQNKHKTINPKIDIESKSTILAGLEADLIQRNVEYNSKSQYLNKSTPEMKLLKRNIVYIEKSIKEIKRKITGSDGKGKLNISMSDFSLLKSKVEFDKNIYMQTLIKLEETKVLISQNTKNIITVSSSQVSDRYSYPNKIKDSFSVLIVLSFIYGILALIFTIIRDHKD